jgi:hypothetical protein
MISPLNNKEIRALAAMLLGAVGSAGPAAGQDFALRVAEAERTFEEGIFPEDLAAVFDLTLGGRLKGAVSTSLAASAAYDSNINLSSTAREDDVTLSVTPAIAYTTDPEGGAQFVIDAYYAPSYQTYLDRSELGRLNHSGGIAFATSGARTSVSAFLSLAQASGADRISDGYAEATIITTGVGATYELAPRTSIWARVTTGTTDYATAQEGSERYALQLGARWAASELLRIGPSLRYSRVEADTTGVRTALGALFNVSYAASERIDLSAALGAESVDNSRQAGDQLKLTGDLRLSYALDERWSTRAAVRYANIPSPESVNYLVNDLTFQASITRTLDYGSLSSGIAYSIEEFQQVGPVATSQRSDDFLTAFLSYQRPILAERAGFFSSLAYSRSEGQRSWQRWLLSVGLSVSF